MPFNYDRDFEQIDFRKHPELYDIGRGEQGVLLVEPYKSELLPLWKFKTPALARESADAIFQKFLDYKAARDFVGMDMARKYLQMGYTRSRRYATRKSGRKYDAQGDLLPTDRDEAKAQSAQIFEQKWILAREDPDYLEMKKAHRKLRDG